MLLCTTCCSTRLRDPPLSTYPNNYEGWGYPAAPLRTPTIYLGICPYPRRHMPCTFPEILLTGPPTSCLCHVINILYLDLIEGCLGLEAFNADNIVAFMAQSVENGQQMLNVSYCSIPCIFGTARGSSLAVNYRTTDVQVTSDRPGTP